MQKEPKIVDFSCLIEADLLERFKRVAKENYTSASDVLSDFVKDYVVSGGHPEQVVNRWPWNKK